MDGQKNYVTLPRMKSTQSKLKPIKTGKKIGTAYCLGCKDYAHNCKPEEVKMTNKVLRKKSNCVVCRPSKSRFLKQKHKKTKNFTDKLNRQFVLSKNKNSFHKLQTCKFILKTVKNT